VARFVVKEYPVTSVKKILSISKGFVR